MLPWFVSKPLEKDKNISTNYRQLGSDQLIDFLPASKVYAFARTSKKFL
jgi:hypothetical protein